MRPLKTSELVHADLSYQIVGVLFRVQNQIGGGHPEKYYQTAIAEELRKSGLKFQEQVHAPLNVGAQHVGRYFLDFLIEDKVVLEIKSGIRWSGRSAIDQVYGYLQATNIKLGIIARFTSIDVRFKRILNIR